MNNARRKQIRSVMEQIKDLMCELETLKMDELYSIQDEEQEAYDNLPFSIQESERGETMDNAISSMEEAMDEIGYAIDSCESACNYLEEAIGE